jgi:hypothetical protein
MQGVPIDFQQKCLLRQRCDKIPLKSLSAFPAEKFGRLGAYKHPQSTFLVDDAFFQKQAHTPMNRDRVNAKEADQLAVGRYLLIRRKQSGENVIGNGLLYLEEDGPIIVQGRSHAMLSNRLQKPIRAAATPVSPNLLWSYS